MKITPKFGTRSVYVLVAVLVWFLTLAILGAFPALNSDQVFTGCERLIEILGAAILGDTWRPSGQARSANHPSPPPEPAPEAT